MFKATAALTRLSSFRSETSVKLHCAPNVGLEARATESKITGWQPVLRKRKPLLVKAERVKEFQTDPRAVRVAARAPRWVVPLVKSLLVVTDIVLTISSFTLAFYLRHQDLVLRQSAGGVFTWSREFAPYALLLPLVIPIRLLLLRYYDLYRLRGEFSFVEDMARVFNATAIGSLLIVAATFMYRGGVAYRTFSYSRAMFLFDFLFALASMGAGRMLLRAAQTLVERG